LLRTSLRFVLRNFAPLFVRVGQISTSATGSVLHER
jgi:hypothetical protein